MGRLDLAGRAWIDRDVAEAIHRYADSRVLAALTEALEAVRKAVGPGTVIRVDYPGWDAMRAAKDAHEFASHDAVEAVQAVISKHTPRPEGEIPF